MIEVFFFQSNVLDIDSRECPATHMEETHNLMPSPDGQLMDPSSPKSDEFWSRNNAKITISGLDRLVKIDIYIPKRNVWIYVGLGMVLIKGELFKMRIDHVDKEDLNQSLLHAVVCQLCKIPSHVVSTSLGTERVGCNVGTYSLNYGCTWKGRLGTFQNQVLLEKWQPGYKTCMQYVLLLQRRRRRLLRERTALPLAMALHARLGNGAGIAALGRDVLEQICCML